MISEKTTLLYSVNFVESCGEPTVSVMLPTSDELQWGLLQVNFLQIGPMRAKPLVGEISRMLSLTEAQKNATDLQNYNILHVTFNAAVLSLMRGNNLIITDHGICTSLASEVWFVYHVLFREILRVPADTPIPIEHINPSIKLILSFGQIFRRLGYLNPYVSRELRVRDLLPIKRLPLGGPPFRKIG
ncbi:MAG: hypothetical protein OXN25_19425 [Candidatus Poribacteria bacterium]|nr:hypothetical protein [Candidatus Poribacteria bacterium]